MQRASGKFYFTPPRSAAVPAAAGGDFHAAVELFVPRLACGRCCGWDSRAPWWLIRLTLDFGLWTLDSIFFAMGAQWKQAGREANAQKKGQMTAKLVREIMVAAKLGGADPDLNARLAAAVEKARKASVYRDTIERAIKKGSGQTEEKVVFELITYEGFAPHKVPVVVECLTDSRNRTAPEIRNIFKAGSLGQPGSVAFFFNHLGVVEATHADSSRDAEGDAIEAGANEIEPLEAEEIPPGHKGARFLTEIKDLDAVSKALKAAGWNIISAEIRYLPKNFPEISEVARKEVADFLNTLDDHEDVHRVYAAMK